MLVCVFWSIVKNISKENTLFIFEPTKSHGVTFQETNLTNCSSPLDSPIAAERKLFVL
jgi:hypothetical protein